MPCSTDTHYWVGGRRDPHEDEFQWLSGVAITDFWQPGQPNHHGHDTANVCTELTIDSLLNDRSCHDEQQRSICEIA